MSDATTRIGIDGCPAGWFFVRRRGAQFDHGVVADVGVLLDDHASSRIAIDIPIGLREQSGALRHCDRDARYLLGKKRSSVFAAPLRGTLAFDTHRAASDWQKARCGKGLSIQAFNICAKIAQIDTLMLNNQTARRTLRESHPELCFLALNNAQPVLATKKSAAGVEQRMALLMPVLPQANQLLHDALRQHPRKVVARDDIIDAMAMLHVACHSQDGNLSVPLAPQFDARGLPMQMIICPPPETAASMRSALTER